MLVFESPPLIYGGFCIPAFPFVQEQFVPMSIGMFLIAGFSIIAITLLAVSYQSVRAAFRNPVTSLPSE